MTGERVGNRAVSELGSCILQAAVERLESSLFDRSGLY